MTTAHDHDNDTAHGGHDEWFTHSIEEGLPQPEHGGHINARALFVFYVAMVGFVVVSAVGVAIYYHRHLLSVRQERTETLRLADDVNEYKERTLRALSEYGWVDEYGGAARVPLEVARDRVLERYSDG